MVLGRFAGPWWRSGRNIEDLAVKDGLDEPAEDYESRGTADDDPDGCENASMSRNDEFFIREAHDSFLGHAYSLIEL